jgi:hypothetical protein
MTTRSLRIMVAMLDVLFAVAASAHAESAWMLWQQATVFTERGWIPTGWSLHWKPPREHPSDYPSFEHSLTANWHMCAIRLATNPHRAGRLWK